MAEQAFSQQGTRSTGMLIGLSMAMVVESVAVHALVAKRWPLADVVLIVVNVLTLVWLVRHWRAVGDRPLVVRESGLGIAHGTLVAVEVPWSQVRSVTRAAWRDLPTDARQGFLKLSGGDDPSVLVACEPPVPVKMMGVPKQVSLFGLRPDDASGFVAAAAAHVGA